MPHAARVVHHIKGRIRVKLPAAKGDGNALRQIQESISPMPGVREVQVNPATGGILVIYDSDHYDDFHKHLTEHGEAVGLFALQSPELSEVDEITKTIHREAEFLASHSKAARTFVDLCKQLNSAVKRATGNAVDLNVLIPLGLAVYSVLELEAEMSTPMWVTLGIFSFNSFVMLHSEQPAQPVQTQELLTEHTHQLLTPDVTVQPRSKKSRKLPSK